MKIMFQLLTIIFLLVFSVKLTMYSKGSGDSSTERSGAIWKVKCSQVAAATSPGILRSLLLRDGQNEVYLSQGALFMGNNVFKDDLVLLNSKRERIRIYLNVLPDKVLLTILQGEIHINGCHFQKNPEKQIVINDCIQVFTNGLKIEFRKVG